LSAWYKAKLIEFAKSDPQAVVGILASAASDHNFPTTPEAIIAWRTAIGGLQQAARIWAKTIPDASEWAILLEYEVPRRRRRIDALILSHDLIHLIEFKVGAGSFNRDARWQTEQYALDIRDFHAESRNRKIVPYLVATNTNSLKPAPGISTHPQINNLQCVNFEGLTSRIPEAYTKLAQETNSEINLSSWDDSPYKPTPWIVEAAKTIYQKHDVREIRASDSINLDQTVESVLELVEECQRLKKHGIAFITGAPGSGKTLAGLQVVHDPRISGNSREATGVFLSGNRPLVEVIRKALATDVSTGQSMGTTASERARRTETFIQHAYQFRDEYAKNPLRIPQEKVILFDEAQRAWDANQVKRFTRNALQHSEPELFLEIMGRVREWSVIIAVVGSGQEINRGEAGLGEWGTAILNSGTDWVVRASPKTLPGNAAIPGQPLVQEPGLFTDFKEDSRLHLDMNVRSPRAESLNQWVDAVIDLRFDDAIKYFAGIKEFPFVLTRDLNAAKEWLTDRTDEDHRCGLVANSSAKRLRAWGLDTNSLRNDNAWADWFLKPKGDIRSSHQLEVPKVDPISWTGLGHY